MLSARLNRYGLFLLINQFNDLFLYESSRYNHLLEAAKVTNICKRDLIDLTLRSCHRVSHVINIFVVDCSNCLQHVTF